MIPPPPRMMTMTISLSLRGLRLICAREREREREREMQENFMKRIKRQPLVSSNGFKRTKYAVERSLFFSEVQSIQRLDMSPLCVVVFFVVFVVVNVPLVRSARSTTEI